MADKSGFAKVAITTDEQVKKAMLKRNESLEIGKTKLSESMDRLNSMEEEFKGKTIELESKIAKKESSSSIVEKSEVKVRSYGEEAAAEEENKGNIIGVGGVKITLPYEVKEVLSIKIKEEINNHTKLLTTCLIDKEVYKTIITTSSEGELVAVTTEDRVLFMGLVGEVKVRCVKEVYYLEIKASSTTIELDIVERTRIFPSGTMSHKEIVDYVLKGYNNVNHISLMEKKPNSMVVQYKETDLAFIKRLASQENLGIIMDAGSSNIRFVIGCADKGEISEVDFKEYSVKKDLKKFHSLNMNTDEILNEQKFKCVTFKSLTPLNILDKVKLGENIYYINKVKGEITSSGLEYSYEAGEKESFMEPYIINKNLIGASLPAVVTGISKDELTVDFPLDMGGTSKNIKYLTPFSLEGDYGWHIMPEAGDSVTVQFPTENESDAYVMTSNPMTGGDSSTKSLTTPHGKSMSLASSGISFSSDAGHSVSIGSDGVTISSTQDINVSGENNVKLNGANISVSAGEMMQLINGDISIIMDGNTHSIGAKVKIN